MKYESFENILSAQRLRRYLNAVHGDTRASMTLYRKNLILSQELFTVISCFEIALRNKIDKHYVSIHGNNWIRNSIAGMFSSDRCHDTRIRIQERIRSLDDNSSHETLIAEMEFGFWRHLFASPQFFAAGSSLLRIFPRKPKSNRIIQYNHSFIFTELRKINDLRNRIAHHEPICFRQGTALIDTAYARRLYEIILELFQWMDINEKR